MEARESFNLRWDGFEANTRSTLMELREEAEFHDVTLVSDDGSQVKANKMVLAGGSKFFHKILRENPHPHPLIYLKDVAYKHLLSVMDYLYTGQANIKEEDLKQFLNTAEDLKIKGLVPPDEQTKSLPETVDPLQNQASAEEHAREKRKTYSTNMIPATQQRQPAAQEQVSSKSVVSSQSNVSTEELAREKKEAYPPNMILATHKGQVDIQGQVSSKSVQLPSPSQMFAEKQFQSKNEMYHFKAVVAGEKSSFQAKTGSSHRATPALQGLISADVRTSKSQEQLPHNVSPSQISNSFQNSDTCKVKVEVPVGDANDYNVHYAFNDQGEHYISSVSKRGVPNNEQNPKYLSEQNDAMEHDHDDQITTEVTKEEPMDNSTTFHSKAAENEEVNNDWYEEQSTHDSYERVTYNDDNKKPPSNSNKNDKYVHKRSHTDERPFQCSFCPKCFSHRGHFNVHTRIHTGEKPYQCSQCSKTFNHKLSLDNHAKIHTGEKPYQCSHCSRTFITSTHLKYHEKSHTGEKPFQCSICPQRFHHQSALTNHSRIHTGEKPYQCPQCFKKFRTSSQFCKHKRDHTG